MKSSRFPKLLLAAAAAFMVAGMPVHSSDEEQLIEVESYSGLLQVQRAGARFPLRDGDALVEGDVLSTDNRGRATLTFARHGFIELGGNAELKFEALPHSRFASDLRTGFKLNKGYLRVVWKRAPSASAWPIYVEIDSLRAALGSGEYFFQAEREPRLCAAAGTLGVQMESSSEVVRPPSCVMLRADKQLVPTPRDTNDWVLVRRAHSLNAGEPVIQEISTPTPANATIVPAGPEASAPKTLATNMPPPKPGMDYSLLTDSAGPGIATSSAAIAPAPAASSAAKPSLEAAVAVPAAPPANAGPIIAAALPAPATTPAAPASRFEVASSPDNLPAPALAAAAIRPAAPLPAPKRKARSLPAVAAPSAAVVAAEAAAAMPAKRGAWRINIGSFDVPAQAQALYARVQAAGLPVRLAEKQLDGRTWTRVQVGSYSTTAAAQAAAPAVRRQLRLGPVWFAQDK